MTGSAFRTGCRKRRVAAAVAFVAILLGTPDTAYAYLEPGTAGIVIQMILGGLAGVAVAMKLYWRTIVGWFGGRRRAGKGRAAVPRDAAKHAKRDGE